MSRGKRSNFAKKSIKRTTAVRMKAINPKRPMTLATMKRGGRDHPDQHLLAAASYYSK